MLILLALLFASPLAAQEFTVSTAQPWSDTGIDLVAGETVKITATGSLKYANASRPASPEGLARAWTDLLRALPVNEAGRGALVGRIGDRDASRPFLIGSRRETRASMAGRLFLGINQIGNESAEGSFQVIIERIKPASAPVQRDVKVPPFSQQLLDSLPRRVIDDAGTEGDRVNFLIVGSENKVQAAFQTAGWVTVDRSNKDAVLRGLIGTLGKQAYTTLPMSELKMFGRPQDFGYAQGDPVRVVASRHHFRLWRAPFQLEGRTVWVGAGTHDIGFDRDQRNNKLTHRIDPEVDKERDYIGRSLSETGVVLKLDYLTPANPVREARTAHGQEYRSDGRTLIIYLEDDGPDFTKAFADIFCSVLKGEKGDWGACNQYLDGSGKDDLDLPPLDPNKYRVLIIPGILSSCASDAPAFLEGQEALKEKYKLDVALLPVPNDSSEDNARRITEYMREKSKDDPRKFILVGYSKGTPDIQTALAKEEGAASMAAAFISVAGASGGSPIADAMPGQADRWISQFKMGNCQGDLSSGFKSLQKRVRQAFLAAFPNPIVPTYSLVAVSDRSNTSKSLQQAWELLSVFASQHDAQVAREDAVVPGAKFLGAARADHFAVALPFDKSADSAIRSFMDRGRYPRAALLEALVRFVAADLDRSK